MLAYKTDGNLVDIFLVTEKRHQIYSNPVVCIIEDLVHVSIGEPVLLTEVAVRTHLYTQMKFYQV
jgi:hypothetical protein